MIYTKLNHSFHVYQYWRKHHVATYVNIITPPAIVLTEGKLYQISLLCHNETKTILYHFFVAQ